MSNFELNFMNCFRSLSRNVEQIKEILKKHDKETEDDPKKKEKCWCDLPKELRSPASFVRMLDKKKEWKYEDIIFCPQCGRKL
jgi:DNA-binding transcriptional MerR regulator